MNSTVTLTLRAADAAPWLHKAARDAAMYGALCDYITSKTYDAPVVTCDTLADSRKRWQMQFLAAKRTVEAFGVEYEPTSEQETLTLHFDYVGGKFVKRGMFTEIVGSKPDYAHPRPCYRREVHSQACKYAADRVVRRWREAMES